MTTNLSWPNLGLYFKHNNCIWRIYACVHEWASTIIKAKLVDGENDECVEIFLKDWEFLVRNGEIITWSEQPEAYILEEVSWESEGF